MCLCVYLCKCVDVWYQVPLFLRATSLAPITIGNIACTVSQCEGKTRRFCRSASGMSTCSAYYDGYTVEKQGITNKPRKTDYTLPPCRRERRTCPCFAILLCHFTTQVTRLLIRYDQSQCHLHTHRYVSVSLSLCRQNLCLCARGTVYLCNDSAATIRGMPVRK
jgi:hypothetical protein